MTFPRAIKPTVLAFTRDEVLDLSPLVTALNGRKSIHNLAGSFNIELLPEKTSGVTSTRAIKEIYAKLSPMDVITIGMQNPHGLVMGIIDNSYKSDSGGPRARAGIGLKCRDFGKLFLQDSLVYSPIGEAQSNGPFDKALKAVFGQNSPLLRFFEQYWRAETLRKNKGFQIYTVKEAFNFLLDNAFTIEIDLPLQGGFKFPVEGKIRKDITAREGDRLYTDLGATYDGSVANLIMRQLDREFYEVWVDSMPPKSTGTETVNAAPVFRVRPTPFDEERLNFTGLTLDPQFTWDNTLTYIHQKPYHVLDGQKIRNIDLGRSDHDMKSFYLMHETRSFYNQPYMEQRGTAWPLIDRYAAKRYGLKDFRAQSIMLNVDKNESVLPLENVTGIDPENILGDLDRTTRERFLEKLIEKRNRLFNWHRMNAHFESGTVRIQGNELIRVGDRVALPEEIAPDGSGGIDDPMVYYVTDISWSWRVKRDFEMVLSLSRGHNKSMIESFLFDIQKRTPAIRVDGRFIDSFLKLP